MTAPTEKAAAERSAVPAKAQAAPGLSGIMSPRNLGRRLTATGGRFNDISFSDCVTNCREKIARRRSNIAPTLRP